MSSPTYIPGEEIARGGMGAVLRATDQKIGRSVAMKVMLRRASTEQVHRFLQEARVLGQLSHPNIVPVYDLGRDDNGTIFYTMKLVQGETLNDILKRLREGDPETLERYPLSTLLTIFQKVCDAVAFAHSRNIIHRDLKPHNVMVGEFGEVLVMDWGLAKVLNTEEKDLPTMTDIFGELDTASPAESAAIKPPEASRMSRELPSTSRDPDTTIATNSGGTIDDPTDANLSVTVRADGITGDGQDYDFVINPQDVGPNLRFDSAPADSPRSDHYVTRDGAIMGTPRYMSTEQAAGDVATLDGRSDIYSLGAILYCILTLRPPVEDDTQSNSPAASRTGTILPPIELTPTHHTRRLMRVSQEGTDEPDEIVNPSEMYSLDHCPGGVVPAALSAVTMKALARDREDRYQTVAELTHDIDAYQSGFATQAEDAGTWRLLQLFVRRHKVVALALLIGVLLVAGFMVKVIEGERRAQASAADALEQARLAGIAETNAVREFQRAQSEMARADANLRQAIANENTAKAATALANENARKAETNRLNAVRNLEEAVKARAEATNNLAIALQEREAARQAAEKEKQAAKAAKDANERAQTARLQAEEGERRQIRNLFESYLTQGILQSAIGDHASAAQALKAARDTAIPEDGTNVVAVGRRALRNTLAWFTSISGLQSASTLTGAGVPLKSVAMAPDGSLTVAGGEDGRLYVYSHGSSTPTVIPAHQDLVTEVEFFPDGLLVASVGADKMVRLFAVAAALGRSDSATMLEPYVKWRAGAPIATLAVSRDGRHLVTGDDDGYLTIWNTKTGEPKLTKAHADAISDVKLSGDGKRLVSASIDRTAKVWNFDEASLDLLFTTPKSEHQLVCAALDHHGRHAVVAGTEGVIRIWNLRQQRSLPLTGHRNAVTDLLFLPDGQRLCSASLDRTICIWDVASGVRLKVLQGHETGVTDLALHAGTLASSGNDQTVRRWLLDAGAEESRTLDLGQRSPRAVAISPQNRRLAVGFADGGLTLFSLPDARRLGTTQEHRGEITRVRFSPDGRRLASSSFDGQILYWEPHDAGLRLLNSFNHHADVVNDLAFSPDGRTLASASIGSRLQVQGDTIASADGSGGEIALLQLDQGAVQRFPAHEREALAVTFNARGDRLLSSGDDGDSILWDHRDGRLVEIRRFTADADMAYTAQFQPGGPRIAAGGRSGTLRVFDSQSDQAIANLPGHENAILRLAYSPDGHQVITAGADGTLRLWDVAKSRVAFVLRLPVARQQHPLWDFAYNYDAASGGWLAVPLANGKLILHHFGPLFDLPATKRVSQNAR